MLRTWAKAITTWLEWQRAGNSRTATIELREYQLRRLASAHADNDPFRLTTDDLATWISAHAWGPESARSYRAALRSFYGWAHATGKMHTNPAALLRPIRPAPAKPRPASDHDIRIALENADTRQRVAITLGAYYGLRRAEIAQVHTQDVWRIDDGYMLTVRGKGGKLRDVPLRVTVAHSILEADGWLFPNGQGSHLSPPHLGKIVRRTLPDGVTTHMLRHRFGTAAYQRSNDIRAVQELLGHASVATTQRYTQPRTDAARRIIDLVA